MREIIIPFSIILLTGYTTGNEPKSRYVGLKPIQSNQTMMPVGQPVPGTMLAAPPGPGMYPQAPVGYPQGPGGYASQPQVIYAQPPVQTHSPAAGGMFSEIKRDFKQSVLRGEWDL